MIPTSTFETSKKSITNTFGAAISAIRGDQTRNFIEIEFLDNDVFNKAGEIKKILVDYIEIGRASDNVIRFSDKFRTVHRKHAAIFKDKRTGKWKIKYLKNPKDPNKSRNPIFINGNFLKPDSEWFLADGDIIQFSNQGPRIRFRQPPVHLSSVRSINFTQRFNNAIGQALIPYKRQIKILSSIVVAILIISGIFIYFQHQKVKEISLHNQGLATQLDSINRANMLLSNKLDSLSNTATNPRRSIAQLRREMDRMRRIIAAQQDSLRQLAQRQRNTSVHSQAAEVATVQDVSDITSKKNYIYFIKLTKIEITIGDNSQTLEDLSWTGTGFLLNDGRFITARHVLQPWLFSSVLREIPNMVYLNIAQFYGSITAQYIAFSPAGDQISFSTSDIHVNNSHLTTIANYTDPNSGSQFEIKGYASITPDDWAYVRTNKRGNLVINADLSNRLPIGTNLFILGYPFGLGAEDAPSISPILAEVTVSNDGLRNGLIYISNRNFDQGHSGSPAMIKQQGDYVVIGIVSAGVGSQGFIVPISVLQNNN